jgi:sigma-E factor negative regulatory protein RseC
MLIEQAKVVALKDGVVQLESIQKSACDACSEQGCSNGVVAKAFGQRLHRFELPDPGNLVVGETVRVALPEKSLLGGAALVYLLPLSGALILALAVAAMQQLSGEKNEILQIIAAVIGGLSGGFIGRWRAQALSQDPAYRIQLLRDEQVPLSITSQKQDSDC